jgi:hypothetical protein
MKKANFARMKFKRKQHLLNIWPFILALIIFAGVKIGANNPGIIEKYYAEGLYPIIARTFSYFSNAVSFSIWDVFWIISTGLLLSALFLVLIRRLKFSTFILRLFQSLALIYSFFYISWGFNYFRPKLDNRIGWEKPMPNDTIFREIFDSIIVKTNKSYSTILSSDYKAIDSIVEKSYRDNSAVLKIDYPNGSRTPKTMILSSVFAKSGVSGYFGPFFNEIHVNDYLLPTEYPFVLAHEKAHQFGITDEAEANFAAFLICTTSSDRRLEYSGNMQLLLYFLSDAHQLNDRMDYVNRIDSLVVKDIKIQRKHWKDLENKTFDKVQTAANNAFLKSNRIEEGVKNYNKVVALVITWYSNKPERLNRKK